MTFDDMLAAFRADGYDFTVEPDGTALFEGHGVRGGFGAGPFAAAQKR